MRICIWIHHAISLPKEKKTEPCYILNFIIIVVNFLILQLNYRVIFLFFFFKVFEDVLWPDCFWISCLETNFSPHNSNNNKHLLKKKKVWLYIEKLIFSLQCDTQNKPYISNFATDADAWNKITLTASIEWVYSPFTLISEM